MANIALAAALAAMRNYQDRTCEACGRQWRGDTAECPTCGFEPPLVKICSWCPDAAENTRIAHEAGLTVTHGMCDDCKEKF